MKNVHRISNKQHGRMKSDVCDLKTQPFCNRCELVHCLAKRCKKSSYPHKCVTVIVLSIFLWLQW